MSDTIRRFQDDDGRVWRALVIQGGAIMLEGNSRSSTSSTLVFQPDDAERPRLQIPVGREKWNAKQFSDAELKAQLALARQLRGKH